VGLIEESSSSFKKGCGRAPGMAGHGYKEVMGYLLAGMTDEAIRLLKETLVTTPSTSSAGCARRLAFSLSPRLFGCRRENHAIIRHHYDHSLELRHCNWGRARSARTGR